jgi:ubiquinol-cytochrome c reductase subunit 6
MSSTLSSFFSSFLPTAYAEEEEKPAKEEEGEAKEEEEEEEAEPEDVSFCRLDE